MIKTMDKVQTINPQRIAWCSIDHTAHQRRWPEKQDLPLYLVPTLQRGNAALDAPASRIQ